MKVAPWVWPERIDLICRRRNSTRCLDRNLSITRFITQTLPFPSYLASSTKRGRMTCCQQIFQCFTARAEFPLIAPGGPCGWRLWTSAFRRNQPITIGRNRLEAVLGRIDSGRPLSTRRRRATAFMDGCSHHCKRHCLKPWLAHLRNAEIGHHKNKNNISGLVIAIVLAYRS